jgi:hypothetical protein
MNSAIVEKAASHHARTIRSNISSIIDTAGIKPRASHSAADFQNW